MRNKDGSRSRSEGDAMFSCCYKPASPPLPPSLATSSTSSLTIRYNLPFVIDEDIWGPICPPHLFDPFMERMSTLLPPLPSLRVLALSSSEALPGLTLGHSTVSSDAGRSIQEKEITNAAALLGTPSSLQLSIEIIALILREGFIRIDSDDVDLVPSSFKQAEAFFSLPLEEKKLKSNSVAVSRSDGKEGIETVPRHVGFRKEGYREFFAVRRDDQNEDVPLKWSQLFKFQAELAENLFVLIAQGLGVSKASLEHLLDSRDVSAKSSVMRVYRYLRPTSSNGPGLFGASTGAHTDAGLLTVSPASNSPGLVVLKPDGSRWVDVEGETLPKTKTSQRFYAFLGEQGSRFFAASSNTDVKNALRPPVHFVDEKEVGSARFSAPFFLRAPLYSSLVKDSHITAEYFLGQLHRRPWALVRTNKQVTAEEYASDF